MTNPEARQIAEQTELKVKVREMVGKITQQHFLQKYVAALEERNLALEARCAEMTKALESIEKTLEVVYDSDVAFWEIQQAIDKVFCR